jgi:hypothetical protein
MPRSRAIRMAKHLRTQVRLIGDTGLDLAGYAVGLDRYGPELDRGIFSENRLLRGNS